MLTIWYFLKFWILFQFYNFDIFLTIFTVTVIWQFRVTLNSIHNSSQGFSTCLSCRWMRRWCWGWPWGCRRGWGSARSSWSRSTSSGGRTPSITPDIFEMTSLTFDCKIWRNFGNVGHRFLNANLIEIEHSHLYAHCRQNFCW